MYGEWKGTWREVGYALSLQVWVTAKLFLFDDDYQESNNGEHSRLHATQH